MATVARARARARARRVQQCRERSLRGTRAQQIGQSMKNCLGNLTLLTTSGNPRLGNQPFSAPDDTVGISKRDALRTSLLKMNQEIARHAEWNEDGIIARGDVLATRAIALWPPA